MALAYIALGSNLDSPIAQVICALGEIDGISATRLVARSRLYESVAVGPDQPNYINAVALIDTALSPIELLDALQSIENAHHRVRRIHWGPRTLDLDIVLFDDRVIDEPRLKVPHPYCRERSFVLYPLADISPDLHFPDGTSLHDALAAVSDDGLTPVSTGASA